MKGCDEEEEKATQLSLFHFFFCCGFLTLSFMKTELCWCFIYGFGSLNIHLEVWFQNDAHALLESFPFFLSPLPYLSLPNLHSSLSFCILIFVLSYLSSLFILSCHWFNFSKSLSTFPLHIEARLTIREPLPDSLPPPSVLFVPLLPPSNPPPPPQ